MSSLWSLGLLVVLGLVVPPAKPETPASAELFLTGRLVESDYVLSAPLIRYTGAVNTTAAEQWNQALGVTLSQVDQPLQVHLRLKPSEGLLVTGVAAESAAAKARLQVNDVILLPSEKVELKVPLDVVAIRQGERINVKLEPSAPKKRYWIGVQTNELEDALRTQLSLSAGRGILISEVIEKSPAQGAGLQKHDVVISLGDGTAIGATDDLARAVQASKGKPLALQIIRHAKSMTLGVTPIERPEEQAEQAKDDATARGLRFLNTQVQQPFWVTLDRQATQPTLHWTAVQALQGSAAPQDATAKVAALQQQVEQLLKEVTALRQSLEKKTAEPKK